MADEQRIKKVIDDNSLTGTDAEIAIALNAVGQDNWVPLTSSAIFEAIDAGEFVGLDDAKKVRVDRVLGLGADIQTDPLSKARAELLDVFGGASTTIASLIAIANQKVSLATANGLGSVQIGDVNRARAI